MRHPQIELLYFFLTIDFILLNLSTLIRLQSAASLCQHLLKYCLTVLNIIDPSRRSSWDYHLLAVARYGVSPSGFD